MVAGLPLADAHRWAMFTPAAIAAGAAAVFAFPLQSGAARFGALDLYRSRPGPLSSDDVEDAMAIARILTGLVLLSQAGAPPGALPEGLDELMDETSQVHQAAGMVSVQLGVCIEDASVALRARAYAHDTSLAEVASEVVARRIRFDR